MSKPVVYIAELDQDVDDLIAARYLHNEGVLEAVVLDPPPTSDLGKARIGMLNRAGIKVLPDIPEGTDSIFVGGALTKVAQFVAGHKISHLVMNGGFVGDNIIQPADQLQKFLGKKYVRTFNFNIDVYSTDIVLSSPNIGKIILVGKNVCHSQKNTTDGIWKSKKDLIEGTYHVRPGKLQHDMLACHEGLVLMGLSNNKPFCVFAPVYPANTDLNGNMTQWGSSMQPTKYNRVFAAIRWRDENEAENLQTID